MSEDKNMNPERVQACGIELSEAWLTGCLSGTPEQVNNGLAVLRVSCVNTLASMIANDCEQRNESFITAINEVLGEISLAASEFQEAIKTGKAEFVPIGDTTQ